MQTKTCTKCGEEKPVTEFHKQKRGKYGVTSRCKGCISKIGWEYKRRPEVRERNLEYQREYQCKYRQRPEYRSYIREYRQRPQTRERTRERNRAYRQDPDRLEQERKRDREDKRLRKELGLVSNRHVEITQKYATRKGRWSDAEVKFLMSSELSLVNIALELGRTYTSVRGKRYEMRKKLEAQQ
ncbi:hypothetical protein [Corynebacterium stationis]|uniref:hypothetical protein n=1 Tax=Corynebacterium stationis TaxID=1705 RepID=UPI0026390F12|nr:hypothetical protein [Corynebacterium stationis]